MNDLDRYFDEQIDYLKRRLAVPNISEDEESEIEAKFLVDFFLRPLEHAAAARQSIPLPLLQKAQKVIRGVYPYWIDNDRIYTFGRERLSLLSVIGRDFDGQDDWDAFFQTFFRKETPPVSVIMPTYQRANVIKKAIDSVLNQTYRELELIVVDDGSADDTERIVKAISDPRLRFIKCEKNGGSSRARNIGIHEARHQLIAFHDDDDLWHSEKLERQVYFLERANKNAGFCYCEMAYHLADGETVYYTPRHDISMVRKQGYLYPELLRRNFIGGPTLLVKRECFEEVGEFSEELRIYEDWELVLRLAERYDAVFVDEALYDYFEHEQSLTTDRSEEHRRVIEESIRTFDARYVKEKMAYGLS